MARKRPRGPPDAAGQNTLLPPAADGGERMEVVMIENVTTLTGLTLDEALRELDAELPAEAYSPVPGAIELTDIDPNWMRVVLNRVFGPCGYGWGYEYAPENLEIRYEVQETRNGERGIYVVMLKHLRFWYKIHYTNTTAICSVHATGASAAPSLPYALKGAITNAIGHAASNIGFQQSVYLGIRSHRSVLRANGIAPVAPEIESSFESSSESTASTATDPAEMQVHFGKMKGKTVAQIWAMGKEGQGWVRWCAVDFQPKSNQDFRLKEAVKAFLSNVHP
jgi:hypothetical protein